MSLSDPTNVIPQPPTPPISSKTKPWFTSLTIIGAIVAWAGAQMHTLSLPSLADALAAVSASPDVYIQIIGLVHQGGAALTYIGGIVVVVGRMRAKHTLT